MLGGRLAPYMGRDDRSADRPGGATLSLPPMPLSLLAAFDFQRHRRTVAYSLSLPK